MGAGSSRAPQGPPPPAASPGANGPGAGPASARTRAPPAAAAAERGPPGEGTRAAHMAALFAVHSLIALAAAAVALGSPYWIAPTPPGLLGIDNAGLLSVCYYGSSLPVFNVDFRGENISTLQLRLEAQNGTGGAPAALEEIMDLWPMNSGCTLVLAPPKNGATRFYENVPFPDGADYSLYQYSIIGAVSLFCVVGLLIVLFLLCFLCTGGNSVAWSAFLQFLLMFQLAAGAVGVVLFIVMVEKIKAADRYGDGSISASNVAVAGPTLTAGEGWQASLLDYFGWAFWLFVAAEGWAILGWPYLCVAISFKDKHQRKLTELTEYEPTTPEVTVPVPVLQADSPESIRKGPGRKDRSESIGDPASRSMSSSRVTLDLDEDGTPAQSSRSTATPTSAVPPA